MCAVCTLCQTDVNTWIPVFFHAVEDPGFMLKSLSMNFLDIGAGPTAFQGFAQCGHYNVYRDIMVSCFMDASLVLSELYIAYTLIGT